LTFLELWIALGQVGSEGFARAMWDRLSAADKAAIGDWLQRPRGRRRLQRKFKESNTALIERAFRKLAEPDDEQPHAETSAAAGAGCGGGGGL
jgi:hypothetical protein